MSNYSAHSGSPPNGSRVPITPAWGSATGGCSYPPRCGRIPCCSSSHRGSVCSSPGRAAPAWHTPHRSSVRRSDMSRGVSSCAALCHRGCITNINLLLSPGMIPHCSPKYGWPVDSASRQMSSSPRLRMTMRVNIAARRLVVLVPLVCKTCRRLNCLASCERALYVSRGQRSCDETVSGEAPGASSSIR